jgi:hypothetical protein
MKWIAVVRVAVRPTVDQQAELKRQVEVGANAVVSSLPGESIMSFRRKVFLKHLVSEALGRQFLSWGSLLANRPRAMVRGSDDA